MEGTLDTIIVGLNWEELIEDQYIFSDLLGNQLATCGVVQEPSSTLTQH